MTPVFTRNRASRSSGYFLLLLLWGLSLSGVSAQDSTVTRRAGAESSLVNDFSLQEAIQYALKNNVNVQNAYTDVESAKAKIGETRSIGLPQLTAQASLLHNIKIQKVILENGAGPFSDPGQPIGAVQAFPFQLKNNGTVSATLSQLLFDGSYFVGLKAAGVYNQLSQKTLTQSRIQTAEAVTKAYYSVLVSQERLALLDYNVRRLDTLLLQTRAQFQNGFVESIDVDRIEVQYNNLKVDMQRTERLLELSKHLLKFQMGYPVNDNIALTDRLAVQNVENFVVQESNDFNYSQRIEYSTLQTQEELASLDIRNVRSGYLPTLSAGLTFGYNPAASQFHKLFDLSERWFDYSFLTVQLQIPIFDGLRKHYKMQQSKLTLNKTKQSKRLLENSIDLERKQSGISLVNSLDALKTQRRNLELAEKVARVAKIKYEQGVGSNIEVVNAEGSLREAQTNYYAALYDALVAKVDSDKANGRLLTD